MPPPPLIPKPKEQDVADMTNQQLFLDARNYVLNNSTKSYATFAPVVKDKEMKPVMIREDIVYSEDLQSNERIFASMANEEVNKPVLK